MRATANLSQQNGAILSHPLIFYSFSRASWIMSIIQDMLIARMFIARFDSNSNQVDEVEFG